MQPKKISATIKKGCESPLTVFADKEKMDLIVLGTRGRTGFKKLLLGSVAEGVVNHSSCPIMVVR